jgi:hypothetical protein
MEMKATPAEPARETGASGDEHQTRQLREEKQGIVPL